MYYHKELPVELGLRDLGKKAKKPKAPVQEFVAPPPSKPSRTFVLAGAILGTVMVGFLVYRLIRK